MDRSKNIVISSTKTTECSITDCQYKRHCANHISAGDFRVEGGFSPILTFGVDKSKIVCWSMFCGESEYTYEGHPSNSTDLGYVDYKAIGQNKTVSVICSYCESSINFYVKYDPVETTYNLQCSECKAILDIDNITKEQLL